MADARQQFIAQRFFTKVVFSNTQYPHDPLTGVPRLKLLVAVLPELPVNIRRQQFIPELQKPECLRLGGQAMDHMAIINAPAPILPGFWVNPWQSGDQSLPHKKSQAVVMYMDTNGFADHP